MLMGLARAVHGPVLLSRGRAVGRFFPRCESAGTPRGVSLDVRAAGRRRPAVLVGGCGRQGTVGAVTGGGGCGVRGSCSTRPLALGRVPLPYGHRLDGPLHPPEEVAVGVDTPVGDESAHPHRPQQLPPGTRGQPRLKLRLAHRQPAPFGRLLQERVHDLAEPPQRVYHPPRRAALPPIHRPPRVAGRAGPPPPLRLQSRPPHLLLRTTTFQSQPAYHAPDLLNVQQEELHHTQVPSHVRPHIPARPSGSGGGGGGRRGCGTSRPSRVRSGRTTAPGGTRGQHLEGCHHHPHLLPAVLRPLSPPLARLPLVVDRLAPPVVGLLAAPLAPAIQLIELAALVGPVAIPVELLEPAVQPLDGHH